MNDKDSITIRLLTIPWVTHTKESFRISNIGNHGSFEVKKDTVLFVGYQAEGTRGRKILDGEEKIKMFGYEIPVVCHVEKIEGLSAHADYKEMIDLYQPLQGRLKKIFLI